MTLSGWVCRLTYLIHSVDVIVVYAGGGGGKNCDSVMKKCCYVVLSNNGGGGVKCWKHEKLGTSKQACSYVFIRENATKHVFSCIFSISAMPTILVYRGLQVCCPQERENGQWLSSA